MEPPVNENVIIVSLFSEYVWPFLNGSFITALAGASLGAWAATIIAERKERKYQIVKEIHNVNAAISVAFSLTNSFLSIKQQHVLSLVDDYGQQMVKIKKIEAAKMQGNKQQNTHYFKQDYRTISIIKLPIDTLRNILYEKISIIGVPLTFVHLLSQSLDGLNEVIQTRNEFVNDCKVNFYSDEKMVEIYFGLKNKNGVTDTTYPDCVYGMLDLLNDCIYFSKTLCEKLTEHGNSIIQKSGSKNFEVYSINFDEAEAKGLLPDVKRYEKWNV